MGGFVMFGSLITKMPPLFAMLMPLISTVIVIFGLQDLKVETSINKLWIPESTTYAENSKYKEDVVGGADSSSFLGISLPRKGGNVLTASLLLELQQRLNDKQQTIVEVDNMTFAFDDVCYNPAGAYNLPCFRMHVLDCFAEGGYDFSSYNAEVWRQLVTQKVVASKPDLIAQYVPAALSQAVASLYKPIINTGLAQNVSQPVGVCNANSNCTYDGPPTILAAALGVPAGTWESDQTCSRV
jgi:hypothetical protein